MIQRLIFEVPAPSLLWQDNPAARAQPRITASFQSIRSDRRALAVPSRVNGNQLPNLGCFCDDFNTELKTRLATGDRPQP